MAQISPNVKFLTQPLMRLSVIPSLKYSACGSALAFTKGRTATELIASPRAENL